MMGQKERNKEEVASLSETFVNACWQPYETLHSQVQAGLQKQDDFLRQSWKQTSQYVSEQREKAQQWQQEMSSKNVYLNHSEAWKNIAEQTQAIMKTPVDFTLELIEKANRERGERMQGIANLHDQFVSVSKQYQRAFFGMWENHLQKTSGV